jgi:hypothetical protein
MDLTSIQGGSRRMRILLIDHANCDPPHTRAHQLRAALEPLRVRATVCGPASVPSLAEQPQGMFAIHLLDTVAASRNLQAAVQAGAAEAFLAAVAGVSPRLLGLVRETARQGIAEAVDAVNPDAIFVMHAGILADLAIETGVPVVVHVGAGDLAAAAAGPVRDLVVATLGSCGAVAVDSATTAAAIRREWADDARLLEEPWGLDGEAAPQVVAACRAAVHRRL